MSTINSIKARALQMAQKATFVRGNYQVAIECSLEEYAKEFDPRYSKVDTTKPAEVICHVLDNGDVITKILFHTVNNMDLEMGLSKKSILEEDDLVDVNTIKFKFLVKLDKCIWVCDGDLYEEPKPKTTKKTTKKK